MTVSYGFGWNVLPKLRLGEKDKGTVRRRYSYEFREGAVETRLDLNHPWRRWQLCGEA